MGKALQMSNVLLRCDSSVFVKVSPSEGSVRPCVDQKLVGESCTVAGPCNEHYIMSIYYHQRTSEESI